MQHAELHAESWGLKMCKMNWSKWLKIIDGKMSAAATAQRCLRATQGGTHSALMNYGRTGTGKTYTTRCFLKRILQEILTGNASALPTAASPTADLRQDNLPTTPACFQVCNALLVAMQLRSGAWIQAPERLPCTLVPTASSCQSHYCLANRCQQHVSAH